MGFVVPESAAMLTALLLALSLLLMWRRRQSGVGRARPLRDADAEPTFAPTVARVMSVGERRAVGLLQVALPGFLVLAHVPLARFLRVPARQSQREWVRHVGHLTADLLVCDSGSQVLAVIDVRSSQTSVGSERRHERLIRTLKTARIPTLVWQEHALPSAAEVRAQLVPLLSAASSRDAEPVSRPSTIAASMPWIPVPEISEVLAEGDNAFDEAMEPVPSAMFEDFEPAPGSTTVH